MKQKVKKEYKKPELSFFGTISYSTKIGFDVPSADLGTSFDAAS